MTSLLENAFAKAAALSPEEQDVLALRLLAELEVENQFDRAIATSAHKLAGMAAEAIDEHRNGQSEELDPERL